MNNNLDISRIYYIASEKNNGEIIKFNTLDLYLETKLHDTIYFYSLDDYIVGMKSFTANQYRYNVERFKSLFDRGLYSNNFSIQRSYDYLIDYFSKLDIFEVKDKEIYKIDGNNCLDKIISILDNSNLDKEYRYLFDFIKYYKGRRDSLELKKEGVK